MKKNKFNNFTIFGSRGFFGSNLVKYLKKNKNKVFTPNTKKFIFKKNLGNVIYCIGTHQASKDPDKALDGNLNILSKVLLNNKFQTFTYLSSIRVYSSNKKTNEEANIITDNKEKDIYFKTLKLAAENLCLQSNNPRIKIVRISNIFGPNFKNQKYLLPSLIRNTKSKKRILITINKNTKKNYLHIDDAIRVILQIIFKGKKRLYNVASDEMISINNIIKLIKKDYKINVYFNKKGKNKSENKINISRIKNEFNFRPIYKFKNEINKIIKDFKI